MTTTAEQRRSDEAVAGLRLSPQQLRLWQLGGGAAAARLDLALAAGVDGERLERALATLVARHEILRTSFPRLAGLELPLQVVGEPYAPQLARLDLAAVAREVGEGEAASRLAAACRPTAEAPLAAALGDLGGGVRRLHLALPALAADRATLDLLAAELAAAYADAGGEGDDADGEEVLQYGQLSEWQHQLLEDDDGAEARQAWRHRWQAAAAPQLPSAGDAGDAADSTDGAAGRGQRTSVSLAGDAAAVAAGRGAAWLLAAWQVLLGRLAGCRSLTVAVHLPGREHELLAGALGPLARRLPLAAEPAPGYRFSEVVAAAEAALAEAREQQEYAEPPPRELRLVGFEYRAADARDDRDDRDDGDDGTPFRVLRRSVLADPCDLELRVEAAAQSGTALTLDGDAARWSVADLARLADQLRAVLGAAAADPETPVGDLELLGRDERRELLVRVNATDAAVDGSRTLPARLEALAVERGADAALEAAARDEGGDGGPSRLSFAELDALAGRLGRRLRALGVAPEVPVGLYVGRSAWGPVAMQGVWKAGGAWVPLDPDDPPARTAALLAETGAGAVVTRRALAAGVAEAVADRLPVVVVDELGDETGAAADSVSPARPEHLAYVLYTSGSTGRPKGVMVPHGALVHLLAALDASVYAPQAGVPPLPAAPRRVSVNAPFVFDGAVKQLVRLAAGDTLCLVPEEARREGAALADWVDSAALDVLDLTPAQVKLLLAAGWAERPAPRPLRVLVGGEALDAATWRRLAADAARSDCGRTFFNLYGPTETTVDATAAAVRGAVPILGAPLANVQTYVVDRRLRPLPARVPGELAIGGGGVSRGYLGRRRETAERFVPDPFSGRPGGRLYRSGDGARWLPAAGALPVLEYLGRLDRQVKLRGVRIEPGEIEGVLGEHPALRQVAVVVREETAGDQRLVAWYVTATGSAATGSAATGSADPGDEELRRLARGRLPEALVPAVFARLDALPLTRNGKVDTAALAALPLPQAQAADEAAEGDAGDPVAQVLAGLWCELLHRERVSPRDDFFDLGGHSLLATRLVIRAREALGVEVPVRLVFEHPSLGAMAAQVAALVRAGAGVAAPPVERQPRDGGGLPLSFSQQRLWFLHQMDPRDASYNSPAGVRFEGPLAVAALEQAMGEIVRRHEVLRTRFAAPDGRPVQIVEAPPAVRFRRVDLSHLAEAERLPAARALAAAEARIPFDLATGPVFRLTLFRLAAEGEAQDHAVQLTVHHVASDAWSRGILIRELASLYAAFAGGAASPLEEPPVGYADYAAWQRAWLDGEVLEAHLRFWRQRLAGAPPVLELPADKPRPPVPSFRGERLGFVLPDDVAAGLRRLARDAGATPFMVLLAAFSVLLGRLAGRQDVVLGTDVAGRTRPEVDALMGFFINQLVLRTDLSGNPTFRQLVARVREWSLAAYAHQELPFDRLVEELQPPRDASRNPIYQVLFVLQNTPKESLDVERVTLRPFGAETASSKLDLALFMGESGPRMGGAFEYSTDLFTADTVRSFSERFQTLLSDVVARPDGRLASLAQRAAGAPGDEDGRRQEASSMKFKQVKPKAVSLPQEDVVEMRPLDGAPTRPLVVEPRVADVDLADWARGNRSLVEEKLAEHGGVLFRGFPVASVADFQRFAESVSDRLFSEYGDLPREDVSGKVYHSTPYPEDKAILFHNESSHLDRWPRKIIFFCVQPAAEGGETPIADCRRVYELLSEETRRRFEEKRLMYVRNYTDALDVSWQSFFHSDDRAEVERLCAESDTVCEWVDGGGLRTRQVCDAVSVHPETGEKLFFNQVQLHHISFLDAETRGSLLSLFGTEGLPRNVYYGDGTPIEDEVMDEVSRAYDAASAVFPWQKHDVILLDNMTIAHSRNPYRGERKIVVALGDLYKPEARASVS